MRLNEKRDVEETKWFVKIVRGNVDEMADK